MAELSAGEITFECIKIAGATIAGCIGLYQYRIAQKWKKAEFVSAEMKDFFADPYISNALKMLDWGARDDYAIYNSPDNEMYTISIKDLKRALLVHDLDVEIHKTVNMTYPGKYKYIRDHFDKLLEALTVIQSHIETGLFSADLVKPYLKDYLKSLVDCHCDDKAYGKPDEKEELKLIMWKFIKHYKYTHIETLVISCTGERPIQVDEEAYKTLHGKIFNVLVEKTKNI